MCGWRNMGGRPARRRAGSKWGLPGRGMGNLAGSNGGRWPGGKEPGRTPGGMGKGGILVGSKPGGILLGSNGGILVGSNGGNLVGSKGGMMAGSGNPGGGLSNRETRGACGS